MVILYSGQKVIWGKKTFKASSGLIEGGRDYRTPTEQKTKDAGPIPEGSYKMKLKEDSKKYAQMNLHTCSLLPSSLLQKIPKGRMADIPLKFRPVYLYDTMGTVVEEITNCYDSFWVNWGTNRLQLTPLSTTKTYGRSGFYVHDSTKKFTHGCIEVEASFFDELRAYMKKNSKAFLILKVKYESPTMKTYS
jgi:Protein of unknown function (DUF2778)